VLVIWGLVMLTAFVLMVVRWLSWLSV